MRHRLRHLPHRRPFPGPNLPLRHTLHYEHLQPRNRLNPTPRSKPQQASLRRPVNQIKHQPAIQFPRLQRRLAHPRKHPHRRSIHDRIEKLRPQPPSLNGLASHSLRQSPSFLNSPRTNPNIRPSPRQSKRHRPRRSSSPQNQNAATCKRQSSFQRPQHPYVIRIVSIQFPTAAHHHGVHSANFCREGIAIIQMPQNRFLVRQSHAKSRNPQRPNRRNKIPQIPHQHRHINRIHTPRAKSSILHLRRKRMPNRIADHRVNSRPPRQPLCAIKRSHLLKRNLPRRGGLAHRRISQSRSRTQRQNARGRGSIAHWHRNHAPPRPCGTQHANRIPQSATLRSNLARVSADARKPPRHPPQVSRRPPKIMKGKQHASAAPQPAKFLARNFLRALNLQIYPPTSSCRSRAQDFHFTRNAPPKFPPSRNAPASDNQAYARSHLQLAPIRSDPPDHPFDFGVPAQPI